MSKYLAGRRPCPLQPHEQSESLGASTSKVRYADVCQEHWPILPKVPMSLNTLSLALTLSVAPTFYS